MLDCVCTVIAHAIDVCGNLFQSNLTFVLSSLSCAKGQRMAVSELPDAASDGRHGSPWNDKT